MKAEIGLISLITLAIIGMTYTVVSEPEAVSVIKAESKLEVKRFDPDNPPPAVSKTFHGVTKWKFECTCEVRYKVLEQFDDPGGCFVRIRVTGIDVGLALPITMWMPDDPPEGLRQHEDGHAEICRRVYADAEKSARKIAESMIGKEYSGTGATIVDASKFASGIAVVDYANEFEAEVAKKCQDISEIYDYLASYTSTDKAKLVDEAFSVYERGKPRQVPLGEQTKSQ